MKKTTNSKLLDVVNREDGLTGIFKMVGSAKSEVLSRRCCWGAGDKFDQTSCSTVYRNITGVSGQKFYEGPLSGVAS